MFPLRNIFNHTVRIQFSEYSKKLTSEPLYNKNPPLIKFHYGKN